MAATLPLVLIPGLLCSARLFAPQIAGLWPFGSVTVADHRRDNEMTAIAARILADAPPRFALAGLSMGGYVAFAILRLAPERVVKLAFLDTSARPDAAEQSAARKNSSVWRERENSVRWSKHLRHASFTAIATMTRRLNVWCGRWPPIRAWRPLYASNRRSHRSQIRGRCSRAFAARHSWWWAREMNSLRRSLQKKFALEFLAHGLS